MCIFSSLLIVWVSVATAQVVAADDARLPHGAVARLGSRVLRPGGPIESVAWSSDGRLVLSVSTVDDRSHLQFWDAASGQLREQFPVGHAATLSPDGRRVLHALTNKFGIGMRDLAAGGTIWEVHGSYPAAFAPDGRSVVYFKAPHLILAEADTGKEIRSFGSINSVRDAVWAVALARDGRFLAALHDDDTVRLWELATGKETGKFAAAGITTLAYAPDGKTLALGGPMVRLIDLSDGHVSWEKDQGDNVCTRLAFAPDGRSLATGHRDGIVRLLDTTNGKELRHCSGHGSRVWGVAFAPDGLTLASCGEDGVVRRWKTSTGEPCQPCDGWPGCTVALAIAPDGRGLATADSIGRLALWKSDTPTPQAVINDKGRRALLGFRPDGMLVTADDNGVTYRHGSTGRVSASTATRQPVLAWSPLKGLLVCGHGDLAVVDAVSGKVLHELESLSAKTIAITPDGSMLVQASVEGLQRFDVANGRKLDGWEQAPDDPMRCTFQAIVLSADGRLLVGGDVGSIPRLFSLEQGWWQVTLEGNGAFGAPALAPDGRLIAAGRKDGAVCVWEVASGRLFAELPGHRGAYPVVAFFPDCRRLASSGADGTILIWDWTVRKADTPDLFHNKDREPLWEALTDEGPHGVESLRNLLASKEEGVDWLREKLRPTPGPTRAQISRLLEQIDDESFEERQAATAALMTYGRQVEPSLRRFLLVGKPSLDAARRVEEILEGWDRNRKGHWLNSEERRATRAVHALERSASPAARRLLTTLAGGGDGAVLTREARAALTRLVPLPPP